MNLCHVVPSLAEQHGGPSKSVQSLCRALARTGHSVELLTTSPEGDSRHAEEAVATHAFQREWPQRLCASNGLREALRTTSADVVHHHSVWLRTLDYARRGAARADAPLVISPRGMMSPWAWDHHRLRKQLARLMVHPGAFRAADGWHATSAEEAADIRARGFTQPVCVAPNGVDAPDPDDTEHARRYWHERCPATRDRRVAVFYSRLHPKKRVLELIDAWATYGPRDWLLLIVGIPEAYTADDLERYAATSGLADRIRAFSGLGQPAPYAIASLFLLPSHNENFGLVIAEAMAHGVPAVVTDTTPWREIQQRGLGWCVPWTEFGTAVREATRESAEALRVRGRAAGTWVLAEFSWDKSARTLSAFYAELRPHCA